MDDATKRKVRRKVEADIKLHQAEIERLQGFLAYIEADEVAPGMVAAFGSDPSRPKRPRRSTTGGPKLADRVMTFMRQQPTGTSLTPQDIEAGLREAGWEPTENGPAVLRRTLRELHRDGELLRPDERRYQLASPPFSALSISAFGGGAAP